MKELKERREQLVKQKAEIVQLKENIESKVGGIRMKKIEMESQQRSIMRLRIALEEKQKEAEVSSPYISHKLI